MAKLQLPIDPFLLTQEFGVNPQDYAQFGLKGHNGWDIRTIYPDTPAGHRNILMPQDCEFFGKGNEGNGGFGLYFEVLTKTSKGYWKHTFGHCLSIEDFKTKKQGEVGGISDDTGNSSASHLHWTVKRVTKNKDGTVTVLDYNNGYFGAVNPQEYVDEVRADLEINPTNPMEDKRPYWFDLMSKVIWGDIGWEKLTQEQIDEFVKEYPHRVSGNGKWGQLVNEAYGEPTDSNVKTVEEVKEKLMEPVDTKKIHEEGRLEGIGQAKDAINKLV